MNPTNSSWPVAMIAMLSMIGVTVIAAASNVPDGERKSPEPWSWLDHIQHNVIYNGADPLKYIAEIMGSAHVDLHAKHTGAPVQTKQSVVTSELNVLISALEKACKGSGGGGPNPTRPLADSVIAKGPGGQGDLLDPRAGDKQWGQLPPRQREQIMQSSNEGFPQGYEKILESYYRRLAQEQVSIEGTETAESAEAEETSATP